MNLCIHCQHHSLTPGEEHVCNHPELVPLSPVTGEELALFCETERSAKGRCGEDGKWFDALPGHEEEEEA